MHLALISELNAAAIARQGIASLERVETEHVEILKSGFLIHLYNVVEAVMDVILIEVAKSTVQFPSSNWSAAVRMEWVRSRAGIERSLEPNQRLMRTVRVLDETIIGSVGIDFKIFSKGNWSDVEIAKIADRLGCTLNIAPSVIVPACNRPFQDDLPPMRYVRHKRNLLAHGSETFSSSAIQLSPPDLERLRAPVIDYMSSVTASFTRYLDRQAFLDANSTKHSCTR